MLHRPLASCCLVAMTGSLKACQIVPVSHEEVELAPEQALTCGLGGCLQFAVLGQFYGLLAQASLVAWKEMIPYAMLPYSEAHFWTSANTAYRQFAVLFLANAIKVCHNVRDCSGIQLTVHVCKKAIHVYHLAPKDL